MRHLREMMSMRSEETEDGLTMTEFVQDPDDYNRTQRFKQIHRGRERVSDFISEMELAKSGSSHYKTESANRLAFLVSLYILELEPLIMQSNFDDSKLIDDNLPFDSLLGFANTLGTIPNKNGKNSTPAPHTSIRYYSAANRFYARVGMDLELGEEDGDAGFEYEDILEEGPPGTGEKPEIGEGGAT